MNRGNLRWKNMDLEFLDQNVSVHEKVFDAVIIGSGAAGYNCAVQLHKSGITDICIVTEKRTAGTSRNTGSDKQTYYKISTSGDDGDSPADMAATLFSGGGMDGDVALAEAANSLRGFYHLADIGVDFPRNEFDEYVGYTTDHDSRRRASSVGPYTSRAMTECLEKEAQGLGIPVFDNHRVIKVMTGSEGKIQAWGILAVADKSRLVILPSRFTVFATGGPAGVYGRTVYPGSQFGASGILAREGVLFSNFGEWQYGIGSITFRWNLSGSYQQVLPRYVSMDEDGREYDFLQDYFPGMNELLTSVFLKGYQWPFDPRKLPGSSLVDIAIYVERHIRNRRVYLDFMHNPGYGAQSFSVDPDLGEVYQYLEQSGALQETPVDRLRAMNEAAFQLYYDHGINLAEDYLEVDVLPQHNNGGAAVDCWWETSMDNLYVAGEAAGSHGVYRPGGSALNSGQAAGYRIARGIFRKINEGKGSVSGFPDTGNVQKQLREFELRLQQLANHGQAGEILKTIQHMNSSYLTFIRSPEGVEKVHRELARFRTGSQSPPAESPGDIPELLKRCRADEVFCLSQLLTESIRFYLGNGGKSRGSYLCLADPAEITDPESLDFVTEEVPAQTVIESFLDRRGNPVASSREVRPIPRRGLWFETEWNRYRKEQERRIV